MEVQLARALEDSLQREVELKSQCDQLLATLKDLIPEEESPKPNKKQFKNPIQSASPSRRLDSEFLTQTQAERLHAKLVAGDLEEASKTWKKVGYSPLASTDIKTNFEFLKEVAKYRDITIGRLESELRVKSKQKKTDQLVEELNQKNNEIDVLRSTLMSKDNTDRDNYSVERYQYEIQEKENDIRELLLEYEKLQNSYDQLKAEFWQSDKEIIHLREQLTKKSQELRSLHESSTSDSKFATLQISDLKSHSELEPLIKSYSETLAHSSYLDSQLKLLRSQKYTVDFVDLLKQSIPYEDAINLNKILIDQFNFKVSEQINNLQPHFIQLLKSNIEIISKEKITKESEIVILNIEINKLKSLLEIESQIESDIKQFIKDKSSPEYWKKIKRDHVRRVEKVYQAQIDELHDCIKDLNANVKDVTQENGNLKVRNEENVKEITSKLKREHETKKQLADLFAKEKLAHEKTKQFLNDKMTSESDSLGSKLKDAQAALESSNKKIFELENEVQMYISLIQDHETQTQGIQTQVNELENSKQKLYSEITRLNKKIQEIVSVNQRDVQELNDKLFEKMEAIEKEKSVNTDKEEKIAQLEKENQNLKREIYDQDYKIKSKENDADNLKKLQKEIKNLKDHIRSNELDLQDKAKLESNLKEHQNKLRVYEDTVKQLKSDLRKITTELQETQNDLAASRRLQESENQRKSLSDHIQISEASKYKELQSKFNSLISDFQNLKNQFAELSEDRNLLFAENTDLIQKNKQQELENNCLKRDMDTKIVEVSRQIKKNDKEFKNLLDQITAKENLIYKLQERNERLENDARDKAFLGSLNEKVEDLEKRYEMLESSQKKLLEDIKLKYMDWCRSTTGSNIQRISPSFYRSTDTTKEISLFIDAFFTEAKSMIAQEYRNNLIEIHDQPLSVPPSDFTSMIDYPQETNEDFIEKANTLLDRLEKIPENKAKIQVIRLLQENVNLKHEMLDKQNKAHMDEEIFKQLKDVRGINEWVLQK